MRRMYSSIFLANVTRYMLITWLEWSYYNRYNFDRYEPQHAINHTASPGTMLHEDSSVEYHPPAYCYETPPQEQKFQSLEAGKPMHMMVEQRSNCWEPVTSAQVNLNGSWLLIENISRFYEQRKLFLKKNDIRSYNKVELTWLLRGCPGLECSKTACSCDFFFTREGEKWSYGGMVLYMFNEYKKIFLK